MTTAMQRRIGGRAVSLNRGSVGLLVATVAVSAFGLLRESAVASALGLDSELDGLVIALGLVLLLGNALVTTATSALLPQMVRDVHDDDPRRGARFVGVVLLVAVAFGGVVGGSVHVGAPAIAAVVAGDHPASTAVVSDVLRRLAWIAISAFAARGVLIAALQARRVYVVPAGIPVVSSAVMATVALVSDSPSASRLAFWFGIGIAIETVCLMARLVVVVRPRLGGFAGCAALLRPVGPRAAHALGAALIFGLNPLIDYAVANQTRDGAAATLALAGRIPLSVAGLLVSVVVTPLYTDLADAYARGGPGALDDALRARLRHLTVVTVGAAAVMAVVGLALAHLFFSAGELDRGDAGTIAGIQLIFFLAVPPYVVGVLMSRALLAADRQAAVLVLGSVGAALNLGLDLVMSRLFGVGGIALATALVYAFTLAAMWRIVLSGPRPGSESDGGRRGGTRFRAGRPPGGASSSGGGSP